MHYFKLKTGAEFGTLSLKDRWGVGDVRDGKFVGIVYIEVPFEPRKMSVIDAAPEAAAGNLAVRVTADEKVDIKIGGSCAGGHIHSDNSNASLYWRCDLRSGDFVIA